MASSLVSLAEVTSSCEAGVPYVGKAWLALKVAEEFAETIDLAFSEREDFRDRYGALCLRLAKVRTRSQD